MASQMQVVLRADVESVGRTSMKIHIEAWAQRFQTHDRDKVTDADFTFVHIDDEGRPRPIPPEVGSPSCRSPCPQRPPTRR